MMESTKNRRIGNDISMQWKVSRNGQPEQLIGMDAHIYLLDPWGKKAPITYSIDGNTVSIEFAGKDQRALGWYTLVLVENEGKDDMYTLDRDHILKLVPKTSEEYGSGLVDIMSDIVYPVAGGGGGTTNYGALLNKPRINGHELNGDQSAEQLGLQPAGNYLTEHQPLTEYAKKTEIPDTSGFATTETVNAKNLEQDTTLTQHSAKLTELEQKVNEGGGGGGGTPGTKNYNDLTNKPKIGGVELTGDKTLEQLCIQPKGDYQPAGDYALKSEIPSTANLAEKVLQVDHSTSDTTFALTPNTLHTWGEVASLNLTFAPEKPGIVNEFIFQFVSGTSATTLSLPSQVKWIGSNSVEANKTYQVSILNNIAVMGGV